MGEVAEQTGETLAQIKSSLDLLHGVVANIDTAQQQMRAQLEHQAVAISDGSTKHDDAARIPRALMEELQLVEQAMADRPPRTAAAQELGAGLSVGRTSLQPVSPRWYGNAPGASSSAAPKGGGSGIAIDPRGGGILGGAAEFWEARGAVDSEALAAVDREALAR